MNNKNQRCFVNVFVEAKERVEAENIASDLCRKFEAHGSAKIEGIEPYWKIENYFELKFVIEEYEDEATCQHIMSEIGTDWTDFKSDLNEAVWNVSENDLSTTQLRWAQIHEFWIPPIDFETKVIITGNKPGLAHLKGEIVIVNGVARRDDGGWNYSVWVESESREWCVDEEELTVFQPEIQGAD